MSRFIEAFKASLPPQHYLTCYRLPTRHNSPQTKLIVFSEELGSCFLKSLRAVGGMNAQVTLNCSSTMYAWAGSKRPVLLTATTGTAEVESWEQ
jgi:hypothetical protein